MEVIKLEPKEEKQEDQEKLKQEEEQEEEKEELRLLQEQLQHTENHDCVFNYIQYNLDKSIQFNTFPLRCFSCNELLGHKSELFMLIRYKYYCDYRDTLNTKEGYSMRDEEFERHECISVRNIQKILNDEVNIFENCNYKTFEALKIHKICCQRMFLSMLV